MSKMKLKLVAKQDAILKNSNKEITVTIASPFLIPATSSQADSIIDDDDPFRAYVLYVLDRQVKEDNYREVYASDGYPEDDAVSKIYDTYCIQHLSELSKWAEQALAQGYQLIWSAEDFDYALPEMPDTTDSLYTESEITDNTEKQ